MNRHQFQQAARHFRSGRISLNELTDRVFDSADYPPVHEATSVEKSQQEPLRPDSQPSQQPETHRVGAEPALDVSSDWPEIVNGSDGQVDPIKARGDQLAAFNRGLLVVNVEPVLASRLQRHFAQGVYDPAAKIFSLSHHA